MHQGGYSGSGKKPTIELSKEQADEMVKVFKHFSEAACPPELIGQPTKPFEHPITKFIPVLFSWTRKTPRYHPVFNTAESRAVDIDFIGYDFRPEAMTDAKILQKASKFIWHNRLKTPQPALLKAWMSGDVDIDGRPKPGVTLDLPDPVFANFADWDRFQQYIVDQKKTGLDYVELAENLLEQSKAGWNLPTTIVNNCERFLTRIEHMPDIREALAMDYVDFALVPTADNNTRPEINLKKSVTRKKISKQQLARLEEIIIYLLPPPLRVGLTRKLSERQLHYLVRAAKWLRPASDPVWKKHRQITVTVTLDKFRHLEQRAKPNGRTAGQQMYAQSNSYERGEYLPTKIIEGRVKAIYFLIRNIANNINQLTKHSNTFQRFVAQKQVIQMLQRLETGVENLTRKAWHEPRPPA